MKAGNQCGGTDTEIINARIFQSVTFSERQYLWLSRYGRQFIKKTLLKKILMHLNYRIKQTQYLP
jgi:hypothetical protein